MSTGLRDFHPDNGRMAKLKPEWTAEDDQRFAMLESLLAYPLEKNLFRPL